LNPKPEDLGRDPYGIALELKDDRRVISKPRKERLHFFEHLEPTATSSAGRLLGAAPQPSAQRFTAWAPKQAASHKVPPETDGLEQHFG
jgi:hypothetical protein